MKKVLKARLRQVYTWFLSVNLVIWSSIRVALASGDGDGPRSTAVLDRLASSDSFDPATVDNKRTGLELLKGLLFDEMIVFTIASVFVLLIALVGAAIIISKRRQF